MAKTVLCPTCQQRKKHRGAKQCLHCHLNSWPQSAAEIPSDQQVREDQKQLQQKAKERDLGKLYREALETIARQQALLDNATQLQSVSGAPLVIEPKYGSGTSEATIITPASDWHIEEKVGDEVGGLNEFTLEIAEKRVTQFFQHSLRLCRLLEQDITIPTWVLPLLGDFITNDIHEEMPEKNGLLPIEAITLAQTWIKSGIDFLLNHTKQQLVIPCHSGNHARTTKTTRFGSEGGHSLEHFMYANLAMLYANEPRVQVQLPKGIHSYLQVYDQTIRFHHGHALKYCGGVGGIYIPVNKALAQWNKGRHADLDVFGHFHQLRDGGNFICNGSIIGYNAFAMSIKADYERPRQALFLMDKKRGRTCLWPILFNV